MIFNCSIFGSIYLKVWSEGVFSQTAQPAVTNVFKKNCSEIYCAAGLTCDRGRGSSQRLVVTGSECLIHRVGWGWKMSDGGTGGGGGADQYLCLSESLRLFNEISLPYLPVPRSG